MRSAERTPRGCPSLLGLTPVQRGVQIFILSPSNSINMIINDKVTRVNTRRTTGSVIYCHDIKLRSRLENVFTALEVVMEGMA